jgi:hypothetical protein
MSKRPISLACTSVSIVLLAGCTASTTTRPQPFSFFEQQYALYYVDATTPVSVPPVNTALHGDGDTLIVNNHLYDKDPREGASDQIGSVHRACLRVDAKPLVEQPTEPFRDLQRDSFCTMTFVFKDRGQLTAQGFMDENAFEAGKTATAAITGGTGEFTHWQGEIALTSLVIPGLVIRTEVRP